MVISAESKIGQYDNWYQEELKAILIKNGVKNLKQQIDLFEKKINQIYQNYPHLQEEFNRSLKQTFTLALSGIIMDNSVVICPLVWFANQHNYDELLEICNQLSLDFFDIQQKGLNQICYQNIKEKVEF